MEIKLLPQMDADVNVDVTPYADLITTSLTKVFSGAGDVIAGALTVSPSSPQAARLRAALAADAAPILADADAVVLAANSADYVDRARRMSANTLAVAEALRLHPAVATIRYPAWTDRPQFDRCRRPNAGFGTLFSMTLKNPETASATFFDRLRVSKGPSLGTNFSLVCPYTILAHYDELAAVEARGVSRWLIRVSVGLEDPAELLARFREALES